jgi:hypothetical protein
MNINCKEFAERHLLNQNPIYTFSFPISLLVAILVFGFAKAFNWSDNSYINQILIPILTLLLSMVLLDIIARQMISKEKKSMLINECKSWHNKPLNNNYPIEKFTSMEKPSVLSGEKHLEIVEEKVLNEKEVVVTPLAEIPHISPFPIESKPIGEMCIQNSNCCGLCSGSGINPCNIIAPIPGPQWIPQSAKNVQERLVKEDYTKAVCDFQGKQK